MNSLYYVVSSAGVLILAAAIVASMWGVWEGPGEVPACTDCAFKLVGPYRVVQREGYAALVVGDVEVARYGWAYVDGRPMRAGEALDCGAATYVAVVDGLLHVSCSGMPGGLAWREAAGGPPTHEGDGGLEVPYLPSPRSAR